MIILYGFLGVIVALPLIAIIRTWFIKAPAAAPRNTCVPEEIQNMYAEKLGDMVRIETLSKKEGEDRIVVI